MDVESVLAGPLRSALRWLAARDAIHDWARANPLARRIVRRFVAGTTLADALAALRDLHRTGFATTIDVLGEATRTPASVAATADEYVRALEALAAAGLDRNVSLKLTAFGLDLDAELCLRHLERVLRIAAATHAFVRIDMEDHRYTDRTLALVRRFHATYPGVGVAIQASLRRSPDDVERLIAERIPVRLVKGAYAEPAAVAFPTRAEVDAAYLRLAERLLATGTPTALATHDAALIDRVRSYAVRAGGSAIGTLEFQLLFGVRRDLQRALADAGHRVRIYMPYGSDWYPYFMRRLAERPANVAFVASSLFREAVGRRR